MPLDRLVVANFKTGLETDRKPFLLSNDAFPTLENAYLWREQIPRKRGTDLLGRLQRNLTNQSLGSTDGSGNFTTSPGTIFSILGLSSTQPNAAIVLKSITVTVGADIFTEPMTPDGTLVGSTGGSGTINYATGVLTLTGAPITTAITITFGYYPDLPVMGFEDFDIGLVNQPTNVAFDTVYSYQFNQGTNIFYDTTFYKNSHIPFTWTGQNYQQFYSVNYLGTNSIANSASNSGCLWVTNGKPGFNFVNGTYVSGSGTSVITFIFTSGGLPFQTLVVNDVLFFNEWPDAGVTINGLSGIVTTIVNAATGTYQVTFPSNQTVSGVGIAELMTNFVSGAGDGIRWYDGDPTVSTSFGWVNFAPPLNAFNASTNPHPFYLVGADIITPFKNRLIFSGVYLTNTLIYPTIQYYPNRIVYSQVGTPFYAQPLPFVISTQAPDPTAWFQNQVGKGGFLTAPYDQSIVTVSPNEDVLIYGLETKQLRLVFTFDDTLPFIFQTINSEFGSQNTFSSVILDTGVLGMASNGITLTTQNSCQRIDLLILDQIFDVGIMDNKSFRVTSIRDYRNEWVYFTYCPGDTTTKTFPSQTLLYNYRDNNWALFDENFTHYGTFRRTTNRTWANIFQFYPTWADWNDPWNFGGDEAFFPDIVGGNQQGFVLIKGKGTDEALSRIITAININNFTITSPNHGLTTDDFIQIQGVIGISGLNDVVFKIRVNNDNSFNYIPNPDIPLPSISGTYLGGGTFKVFSRPKIQTKQFPINWKGAHGSRAGTQRYLLETNSYPLSGIISGATRANPCVITSTNHGLTNNEIILIIGVNGMYELNNNYYSVTVIDANSFSLNNLNSTLFHAYTNSGSWTTSPPQITAQVFSSQNAKNPSNNPDYSYLIFSNIVLTSPEPNLYGSNPSFAQGQEQTWHRQSNSFNGDTVQFGFTLSDRQMYDINVNTQEIKLYAIVLDLYPGPVIC